MRKYPVCPVCGGDNGKNKYCSPACKLKGKPRCKAPGCDAKVAAHGYCWEHRNRYLGITKLPMDEPVRGRGLRLQVPRRKDPTNCLVCGTPTGSGNKRYCSQECRCASMGVCCIEGCGRPARTRASKLCQTHHARLMGRRKAKMNDPIGIDYCKRRNNERANDPATTQQTKV